MSEDFPAFGRPTMAMPSGDAGRVGRLVDLGVRKPAGERSIVSSRPEMPRPCAALIGTAFAKPSARNQSRDLRVCRWSILLITRTTGLRLAQDLGELLIDRGESVLRVDHKQDHIAVAHGGIDRAPNLGAISS